MLKEYNKSTEHQLKLAAKYITSGGVVAFPTETVYGLGADATNLAAIQRVFAIKGRPANHPVIVHISSARDLSSWATNIPNDAYVLANYFWPGPLTLLLPKHSTVLSQITAGSDFIGLRVPRHPMTLALLRQIRTGLIGPSANLFGRVSSTCSQHVVDDFAEQIDLILDGGDCQIGLESTIVSFTDGNPKILRLGAISSHQISAVLGKDVPFVSAKVAVPGALAHHYSPVTPSMMVSRKDLFEVVTNFLSKKKSLAVLSMQSNLLKRNSITWLQARMDHADYAFNIYKRLRFLDRLEKDLIIIEQPPINNNWLAIQDRLNKATARGD